MVEGGLGCREKSVVTAARDQWIVIVVAKSVVFKHHDEDAKGKFMGRVAGVVGPALRIDLAEATHEERKNGHVPKRRDRIYIRVQRYHHLLIQMLAPAYQLSARASERLYT